MSRPALRLLPRLGAPRGCPEQADRPPLPDVPALPTVRAVQLPLFAARALEGAELELDRWIEEGRELAQVEAAWD